MRHRKRGRGLDRNSAHRTALRRNLALALFLHERIVTTPAKAKEVKSLVEKMITLAKDGSLAARRHALAVLTDKAMVKKLFAEIGPKFKDRPGGYTRILHLDKFRLGDNAPQCFFELVTYTPEKKKEEGKKEEKAATPALEAPKAQASEAQAPQAQAQAQAPKAATPAQS